MTTALSTNPNNNLLIVDDEVEITKSIARQFRRKYNVFTATHASDAIEIMEKENIQVVLSDQRMPGITGVDFFSKIKTKYPDALKLILTGYSDIEAVIGAINRGQVFRYLTKPWNPIELENTINEAFEKYELITNNKKLTNELQEANKFLEERVKERTAQLEESNIKLRELNIEKNKYIGIVAHDLRNPVGAAQSFSDLLLEGFNRFKDEEKIKFLEIIKERSSFALNLITGFLDVSKIEAGIFKLHLESNDFIEFVKKNITQNNFLAQNKGQSILLKTDLNELVFSFDSDKIEQVLSNYISNAIKYSLPNKKITISISKDDNKVKTSVIDEGQGIAADELSKVFDPYKITSTKSTANEKSTGLGLAIVKKIIDSHNGNVSVESEVDKGSVFSFTLPIVLN